MRAALAASVLGNVVLVLVAIGAALVARRLNAEIVRRDRERWGVDEPARTRAGR